jgi:hypothetical protein
MACPTFVRTQFLGGGIVRYSARLGWGGHGGVGGKSELEVEVVEDQNCGGGVGYGDNGWGASTTSSSDSFNPPEIGKPCEFHFSTFRFGGIINDWYEQNSATGAKTYLVRLTDPTEILEGAQLICKGYTGETFYMPNLYNIYGWLEENFGAGCPNWSGTIGPPAGFNVALRYTPATGFGGANDRGGLPWSDLFLAIQTMTGGASSRFGGLLDYRGQDYYLDLSEMPFLDPEIKFSSDSYSLYGLITEVCELAQYDFFVELAAENVIAIRTSRRDTGSSDGGALTVDTSVGTSIDARLNSGVVGSSVGSYSEPVSTQRGLELRSSVVNAFLTGDYRRDMWQISFAGGCFPTATIWPYWGKDQNTGDVILGTGCANDNFTSEHTFEIDVSDLGLPGITRWTVDTTELRSCLNGEGPWRTYVFHRDRTLERSINMMVDNVLTIYGTTSILM